MSGGGVEVGDDIDILVVCFYKVNLHIAKNKNFLHSYRLPGKFK